MTDISEAADGALGQSATVYDRIITYVFEQHFVPNTVVIPFERDAIIQAAAALGLPRPKNVGDVVYAYRFRKPLPTSVQA